MDKFMDNPWFLRFTALFLAVILFYSVQTEKGETNGNKIGDQIDMISDIPVEVYYDNENLVVTGVPETVNITVEGPINLVKTTKLLRDFSLIVDLRTLPMGKHQVRIQPENISEKLQVRIDPATVEVTIEEKITETFKVEPELNERLLASDYHVVNMEVLPSTIEVTGAKSIVESISFVKATVSGEENISKSFEQEARVRVLDRDLNKLNVSIVPETVTVKVEIEENNKEVPIVIQSKGTPPDGVTIDKLSPVEDKIKLFGPSKVLDAIEVLIIDVDVSKIEGPKTLDVDVKLPRGVSAMSLTKVKVDVEATVVEPEDDEEEEAISDELEDGVASTSTETVEFEIGHIDIKGLDQKFVSTLLKPESGLISLTIVAESDIIEKLDASDFIVSVDASATATEGDYIYPVMVEGPTNTKWTLSEEEVTMRIELA